MCFQYSQFFPQVNPRLEFHYKLVEIIWAEVMFFNASVSFSSLAQSYLDVASFLFFVESLNKLKE